MAKKKIVFVCTECGHQEINWAGRCSGCGEWNTIEERTITKGKNKSTSRSHKTVTAEKLRDVQVSNKKRFPTDISEFDRVMGFNENKTKTGIVHDSLTLLAGEPGAGKSTILTQIANNVAASGKKVLYCTGEESMGQVKARANRLTNNNIHGNLYIISENCMETVLEVINTKDPDFIIIDSIHKMQLAELDARPGGRVQVVECTERLYNIAKVKTTKRPYY